jgi:hypothetical protein
LSDDQSSSESDDQPASVEETGSLFPPANDLPVQFMSSIAQAVAETHRKTHQQRVKMAGDQMISAG